MSSTRRIRPRSERRSRLLAASACSLLLAPAGFVRSPEEVDTAALLEAAREQQIVDLSSWRDFRFVREVHRQRLQHGAEWIDVEHLLFRVEPRGERFDERLLRIDGREPKPKEVASHRRAARFSDHYERTITGRGEDVDEGYALGDLLSLPTYRFAGEETVDGERCLRFDFEPAQEAPSGFAGRVARASEGTLWLSADGGHLVRAEARTVSTLRFAAGLVRIPYVAVEYRARRIEEGLWLPIEIVLESEVRLFGNGARKRNHYRYSDHERVRRRGAGR